MRTTGFGMLLCLASVGLSQTPEGDTLQSLLMEVHRLRQEIAAMPAGAGQTTASPTRLEGFAPTAGTVVTLGFENLGVLPGISVQVRESRDAKGGSARGLIVEVTETLVRQERSFVDADEIGGLLNSIDALLSIVSNPTEFKNFEVTYTTRGNLQLTASSSSSGEIQYGISAGRFATASKVALSAMDIQQLRAVFAAAREKLTSLPGR